MAKRIQKLPKELYTVQWDELDCANIFFWYYKEDELKRKCCASPEEAMQLILRAEKAGFAAYASAYVPCNKQHGVFAMTFEGRFKRFLSEPYVYDVIEKAKKSVLGMQVIKKKPEPKKVSDGKDDPMSFVIKVRYEPNGDLFSFRCKNAHLPGELVCVYTKKRGETTKTYKNVEVVEQTIMSQSQIIALANALGYADLASVYCEYAIDIPEAWALLRS